MYVIVIHCLLHRLLLQLTFAYAYRMLFFISLAYLLDNLIFNFYVIAILLLTLQRTRKKTDFTIDLIRYYSMLYAFAYIRVTHLSARWTLTNNDDMMTYVAPFQPNTNQHLIFTKKILLHSQTTYFWLLIGSREERLIDVIIDTWYEMQWVMIMMRTGKSVIA